MKKVIILIPVFNDWESLQKLIIEIDMIIKDLKEFSFECLVINDASTVISPKLSKPKNFKALKVLNMKQNKGHARCNAFGLKYICKNEKFNYVILMDGDGEDRPVEIKSLAKKILENPNESVVAKRMKRSEGIFFQFLYQTHKLITLIFTGKKINFGNYSCLIEKDVEKLSTKSSLWSSFSGSFKKNVKNYNEIESFRGVRYFGPSKMSLYNLLIHSFSIIAVFRYQVFLRSFLIIIVLNYLKMYLGTASIIFQIMIIIFNFIIFVVSFREKEEELINSHENLRNVEKVTH